MDMCLSQIRICYLRVRVWLKKITPNQGAKYTGLVCHEQNLEIWKKIKKLNEEER
jgi:hypothetical protein